MSLGLLSPAPLSSPALPGRVVARVFGFLADLFLAQVGSPFAGRAVSIGRLP